MENSKIQDKEKDQKYWQTMKYKKNSEVQEDPPVFTQIIAQSTQEVEQELHEDPISGVQEDPPECT